MAERHESVLLEAQALVHGDRQRAYGHPLDDFSRTATLVNALLAKKLAVPLDAADVATILVCVKLSRQVNAPKRDNLVDLAGYAETWQMVLDRQAEGTEYVATVSPGTSELEALDRSSARRAIREPSLAARLKALGPPAANPSASHVPAFTQPCASASGANLGGQGQREEGFA